MDLLLATHNAHKTVEVQRILGSDFAVRDLNAHPEIPETEETGSTFEENAALKAVAASKYFPSPVIADDSGLEVDALDGAPGVYSARYAGEEATDEANNNQLLKELAAKKGPRSARFRCVMAIARQGKLIETFEGVVEGAVTDSPRGSGGFGYDPLFLPAGFEETFGELPPVKKDTISHRYRALEKVRAWLTTNPAPESQ